MENKLFSQLEVEPKNPHSLRDNSNDYQSLRKASINRLSDEVAKIIPPHKNSEDHGDGASVLSGQSTKKSKHEDGSYEESTEELRIISEKGEAL
jgi:hypothetical protein